MDFKGLSQEQAKQKLKQYGENSFSQKKQSIFKKLFSFFWGPIPWMIEAAAILSALLHNWPDFIVILSMLIINALLGFIQEFKADKAISILKKNLALTARVLRDGKWIDIEAKYLVPQDIINVKLGNIIPADIKLISGKFLSIDQSALTGESLPVNKTINDEAYSGTIVKMGEMIGEVTKTGMHTFFGKTAKLIGQAKTKSHFQQAVLKIGNFLILSTLSICTIMLLVSLFRVEIFHTAKETIAQIAIFILVLIVAGIPIALPAVLSATMAIGASKLASMKAILSKLTAIEELANMDILCSDKTGTLTLNKLTINNIEVFNSDEKNLLLSAVLASNIDSADPIDKAIYNYLQDKNALKNFQKKDFTPFDPVSKKAEAVISYNNNSYKVCKGAPQVILGLVKKDENLNKKVTDSIIANAKKGYRTLGVAQTDNKGNWQFLGLISLFDPPRAETKKTLSTIQQMGIKIKMITGDHEAIAKELSEKLQLGTNIISVKHLFDETQSNAKQEEVIDKADGFAEVYPEHKFEIVKSLQDKKHIVGMTGDGVNDAPALKQANIGIAVNGATDAAKEAADLVLTKPGLMVITKAIIEARKIFGRMKSYVMYRISETCRLLLFLAVSTLVFNDHPLSAVMIILIALLNDIPIMMIAYDNMRPHSNPVNWNMKEIIIISLGLAIIGVISTFGLFWIGDTYWFSSISDPTQKFYALKTLSFMGILCGGNLTIYLTRNIGTIWQNPLPEWKFFLATLFSLIIGTLASVYGLGTKDFIGIGWKYVLYSWGYILIWFIICMLVKEGLYRLIGYKKEFMSEFLEKTGNIK